MVLVMRDRLLKSFAVFIMISSFNSSIISWRFLLCKSKVLYLFYWWTFDKEIYLLVTVFMRLFSYSSSLILIIKKARFYFKAEISFKSNSWQLEPFSTPKISIISS